jgi:hypothetical protein
MTVPEYRFIGVDLLTRTVIEDLPLYGTSFSRKISSAGSMTGSFKLGTGLWSDTDLIGATEPGLRAIFALRNNQCIWAGPIWSRTYDSQASVVSITGQTYESIFAQIQVGSQINWTMDQTLAFKALIDLMQSQGATNFGIDTSQIGASGVMTTLNVNWYEHKMFSDPVDTLLSAAGSFDYFIDYTLDPTTNNIGIVAKVGYPYLGFGQHGIDADYPGSITNYYWPESAAKGAVTETLLGQGEGTATLVGVYTQADLIASGYPNWARVDTAKTINDPVLLGRVAAETANAYRIPVAVPTFNLKVDEAVDFNEWSNFGIPFNAHIQDPRFPKGKDVNARMIGWDLTTATSENVEQVNVVIDGQDT